MFIKNKNGRKDYRIYIKKIQEDVTKYIAQVQQYRLNDRVRGGEWYLMAERTLSAMTMKEAKKEAQVLLENIELFIQTGHPQHKAYRQRIEEDFSYGPFGDRLTPESTEEGMLKKAAYRRGVIRERLNFLFFQSGANLLKEEEIKEGQNPYIKGYSKTYVLTVGGKTFSQFWFLVKENSDGTFTGYWATSRDGRYIITKGVEWLFTLRSYVDAVCDCDTIKGSPTLDSCLKEGLSDLFHMLMGHLAVQSVDPMKELIEDLDANVCYEPKAPEWMYNLNVGLQPG